MRKTLTLLAFLVMTHAAQAQSVPENSLKQMEWLLGRWTRTNTSPGKSGFENWTKVSPTEWMGRGISMKGTDTTFVEKLKIVIENKKLYYVADVPENKKLVYFEITLVTSDSFVCENPSHDFPKKIAYRFDGKEIRARVSAGEQGMDFVFVRSK